MIVFLRAAHLVGLVGGGAAFLGGQPLAGNPFVLTLLFSGVAMVLADLAASPAYLGQVAGAAVLVKLLLIAWFAAVPAHREAVFWILLVFSAVIAHAPARVRHRSLFGAGRPSSS